jgi:hypothetical protein
MGGESGARQVVFRVCRWRPFFPRTA